MSVHSRRDQRRWDVAVSLLSLDRSRPFLEWVRVPATYPDQLLHVLRRLVVENRRAFADDPLVMPDLRARIVETFDVSYGTTASKAFENWVCHGFVYVPLDLRPADDW